MNQAAVVRSGEYRSLRATSNIEKGTTILSIDGEEVPLPSRHSVQIGRGIHILPHMPGSLRSPCVWQFMNHSCEPNVVVDTESRRFVARRSIKSGEELTFNYNTTEWDMAEPFDCNCSSVSCVGTVRGFRYLPPVLQAELAGECAPHIRNLIGNTAEGPAKETAGYASPA